MSITSANHGVVFLDKRVQRASGISTDELADGLQTVRCPNCDGRAWALAGEIKRISRGFLRGWNYVAELQRDVCRNPITAGREGQLGLRDRIDSPPSPPTPPTARARRAHPEGDATGASPSPSPGRVDSYVSDGLNSGSEEPFRCGPCACAAERRARWRCISASRQKG
jgi:hypothetical protein